MNRWLHHFRQFGVYIFSAVRGLGEHLRGRWHKEGICGGVWKCLLRQRWRFISRRDVPPQVKLPELDLPLTVVSINGLNAVDQRELGPVVNPMVGHAPEVIEALEPGTRAEWHKIVVGFHEKSVEAMIAWSSKLVANHGCANIALYLRAEIPEMPPDKDQAGNVTSAKICCRLVILRSTVRTGQTVLIPAILAKAYENHL